MTPEQIEKHKADIDKLDVIQMARLRRFAPAGHIYFDRKFSLYLHFENRFQSLGGMTAEVSKLIGFDA